MDSAIQYIDIENDIYCINQQCKHLVARPLHADNV